MDFYWSGDFKVKGQCIFNCIPQTNVLGGGGGGGSGYYGLVIVTPCPQRFHRSHDNL